MYIHLHIGDKRISGAWLLAIFMILVYLSACWAGHYKEEAESWKSNFISIQEAREARTPEGLQKRIGVLEGWISDHEPYTWFRSTGEPFLNFDEPPHYRESMYPNSPKFIDSPPVLKLDTSIGAYMRAVPFLKCPECLEIREDPQFVKICPKCVTRTSAPLDSLRR